MIRYAALFISFFNILTTALAQEAVIPSIAKTGRTISSFIPAGWDTLLTRTCDFNKDNKEDRILILQSKADTAYIDNVRMLVILAGGKSGYTCTASSSAAIMCRTCGGVFGDPFSGIEIKGSVLTVYHYGGSSYRWYFTHKYRYQQNDWYMIGRTSGGGNINRYCDSLNDFVNSSKDENLVTGEVEDTSISEDCEAEEKKYKVTPLPLIKLSALREEDIGN